MMDLLAKADGKGRVAQGYADFKAQILYKYARFSHLKLSAADMPMSLEIGPDFSY
jgi:hypothetical protein